MATKKAFWDTKNPNKKSVPLTSAQKTSAKARAKKAGRPYPNLVDNAAAKRGRDDVGVGIGGGKKTVYRKPKLEKPIKAKPYKNNDRWHYNGL